VLEFRAISDQKGFSGLKEEEIITKHLEWNLHRTLGQNQIIVVHTMLELKETFVPAYPYQSAKRLMVYG